MVGAGYHGFYKLVQLRRDQGIIDYVKDQDQFNNEHCSYDIYTLTNKGHRLADEFGIYPPEVTRLERRKFHKGERGFQNVKVRNFAHAMMICNVLNSLEIACNQHGLRFISWGEIKALMKNPKDIVLPYSVIHNGERVEGKLVSDGLFGIEWPDGKRSYFIIECENTGVPSRSDLKNQNSFLRKSIGYNHIIRSKSYQEPLGVKNLRVLVCSSEEWRTEGQIEVVEKELGPSNIFLFMKVPEHHADSRTVEPFPEILTWDWRRAGMDPTSLYFPEGRG